MSFSEHSEPALTAEILRLTRLRTTLAHEANRPAAQRESAFVPGVTPVPYAARVFDADEVEAAVKSSLDFWLTLGVEGEARRRRRSLALRRGDGTQPSASRTGRNETNFRPGVLGSAHPAR